MIEGSLRKVPLTDVFQIVTTGQKSGLLTLERREAIARIYVDHGRVRVARMEPGPHLGEMLVRLELLSAGEVQLLLDDKGHLADGPPLGRLAVDRELLSEDDLKRSLRHQAVEVLAELLSWKDGQFSFTERPLEAETLVPGAGHDAMQLLLAADAMRRDLDEGTADPSTVFEQAGDPTDHDLPAGAWDLLGVLDGRLTARTLVAETDMTEIEGLRVLHRMEQLGVIRATARAGAQTAVLVVCAQAAMCRLLRLALQRADMRVELFSDADEAFAAIDHVRPHALVVDARSSDAWAFLRRLRETPGRAHLPALVLEDEAATVGWFGRWRRPKADTMSYPFDELELQQTVARLAGRRLL